MWDPIVVSGASGTISSLYGWALNLTLTDAHLTVDNLGRFQFGCSLSIDAHSSLTINQFGSSSTSDFGACAIACAGELTVSTARNIGGDGQALDLGLTGHATYTSYDGLAHAITGSQIAATLPGTVPDGGDITWSGDGRYALVTRTLVTLSENVSWVWAGEADIDITTDLAYSDSVLTATAADAGKYTITQDASGIAVSYVVDTVPEPATATLLLLSLCGLARRRRA